MSIVFIDVVFHVWYDTESSGVLTLTPTALNFTEASLELLTEQCRSELALSVNRIRIGFGFGSSTFEYVDFLSMWN